MGSGRQLVGKQTGHSGVVTDWGTHFREWTVSADRRDVATARDGALEAPGGTTFVDEDAFRSLYDRTAPRLRSFLRLRSGDTALADDLLQDSFVRFLRAGVSDLNEFQMKAYMYKTALSALNDHHRARTRELRQTEQMLPETVAAGNPHLSYDIQRVFGELEPRQQSLLWLAYVEGFQHREIADLLDIGEKSVRVVLYRARKQLAEMLTKKGLGPGNGS